LRGTQSQVPKPLIRNAGALAQDKVVTQDCDIRNLA
jgi:hypothetical protein